MLDLTFAEKIVFIFVLLIYLVSAWLGVRQLSRASEKHRWLLVSLIALAVSLESVILIFRAVSIKAVPLTGLFDSMIVLTLVFGLTYLFLGTFIRQVWFNSVMVWIICGMAVLTAMVAEPASKLEPAARTPWIIAHSMSMTLAAAMIAFAAGMAWLFLLTRRRLKDKQFTRILGKMPNIEKLERMNLLGLTSCFILMTFGLVSGIGMAMLRSTALDLQLVDWLVDSKMVLIAAGWLLIGVILLLRHIASLRGRVVAYMTITAFVVIIFAIVVTTIFCSTAHDFGAPETDIVETRE